MFLIELRSGGSTFYPFDDYKKAKRFLSDNYASNGIMKELKPFEYNNKIYYHSITNHDIQAIYNNDFNYLCKYNKNELTVTEAIEKYSNTWEPPF